MIPPDDAAPLTKKQARALIEEGQKNAESLRKRIRAMQQPFDENDEIRELKSVIRARDATIAQLREELAEARTRALEDAANLCEAVRCRNWDAKECAWQIRDQLIARPAREALRAAEAPTPSTEAIFERLVELGVSPEQAAEGVRRAHESAAEADGGKEGA